MVIAVSLVVAVSGVLSAALTQPMTAEVQHLSSTRPISSALGSTDGVGPHSGS